MVKLDTLLQNVSMVKMVERSYKAPIDPWVRIKRRRSTDKKEEATRRRTTCIILKMMPQMKKVPQKITIVRMKEKLIFV